MANTFIREDQIAEAAVLLLEREIVLPRTVWAQSTAAGDYGEDDTITLRIPAVLTASNRTMRAEAGLTAGTLTETKVPVKLTNHVHSLLNITDEQLTLDIRNFSAQVLSRQMRAVAEGVEDRVAAALGAATWHADPIPFVEGSDKPFDVLRKASRELNKLNVPRSGRYFVCGANVESALLNDDRFYNSRNELTDTAFAEATIARLAGFTIVGSNALGADDAYAYHMSAVALGVVAPALPDGAAMKARVATETMALRYLRDYNPAGTTGPADRSLVDAFVGAVSIEQGEVSLETNRRGLEIQFTGEGASS